MSSTQRVYVAIGAAMVLTLAAPFVLRPRHATSPRKADEALVIVSPHTESIRWEFTRAFADHYKKKTGKRVHIDWRTPGGTSEIRRYINSSFAAAFEYFWKRKLNRRWTSAHLDGFDDPKVVLDDSPENDSPGQAARRAFLASSVGIGVDLFFGGGPYDFSLQAKAGRIVTLGVFSRHPDWFGEDGIPAKVSGEPYFDFSPIALTKSLKAFRIPGDEEVFLPQGGDVYFIESLKGGGCLVASEAGLVKLDAENLKALGVGKDALRGLRGGRWVGNVLSSFGICYNTDVLGRLRRERENSVMVAETKHLPYWLQDIIAQGELKAPSQWADLGDPRYFGEIAMADPTKSSSATKAFEMLIQQQMRWAVENYKPDPQAPPRVRERMAEDALRRGWAEGMKLIQAISANSRYFTDSSTKPPFDVCYGNAAVAMCIDFFGRVQSETVKRADGSSRLKFLTPLGGSSMNVDTIAMFRGASNPALAREFIDFVLSREGQKIWAFRVGEPGGPVRTALRRLPVRRDMYREEILAHASDPNEKPYETANAFTYRPEWTDRHFRAIQFVVKVMCLDTHEEQKAAWEALIKAGFPPRATATFFETFYVNYDNVTRGRIHQLLGSGKKFQLVTLARELSGAFRGNYLKAARLAEQGF